MTDKLINETKTLIFSQALGTAINSTKVMTAQQVLKTEDGGEVRTAELVTMTSKVCN